MTYQLSICFAVPAQWDHQFIQQTLHGLISPDMGQRGTSVTVGESPAALAPYGVSSPAGLLRRGSAWGRSGPPLLTLQAEILVGKWGPLAAHRESLQTGGGGIFSLWAAGQEGPRAQATGWGQRE